MIVVAVVVVVVVIVGIVAITMRITAIIVGNFIFKFEIEPIATHCSPNTVTSQSICMDGCHTAIAV